MENSAGDPFFTAGRLPAARPGPAASQHCVLFAVDVAGFTDRRRDDQVQLGVRRALYDLVPAAFDDAQLDWAGCLNEDRGDGVLVIIPARMPSATVVDPLLGLLRAGLRRHNRTASPAGAIRLRVAVHIGEVHRDDHGLAGTAVNHLFRLLDAPAFKEALAGSSGEIALIVSDYFYDSVVRHGPGCVDPASFRPVRVVVKETDARGWVHLPGTPPGTVPAVPDEAAEPRDAHGRNVPATGPPGAGMVFLGEVTVHGDVVAGNKIVYGNGE